MGDQEVILYDLHGAGFGPTVSLTEMMQLQAGALLAAAQVKFFVNAKFREVHDGPPAGRIGSPSRHIEEFLLADKWLIGSRGGLLGPACQCHRDKLR